MVEVVYGRLSLVEQTGPHREQEGEVDVVFQKPPGDHPVEKVVTQEDPGSQRKLPGQIDEEGPRAECSGVTAPITCLLSRWTGGEAAQCAYVVGPGTCSGNS